jgi:hypothetical protein
VVFVVVVVLLLKAIFISDYSFRLDSSKDIIGLMHINISRPLGTNHQVALWKVT